MSPPPHGAPAGPWNAPQPGQQPGLPYGQPNPYAQQPAYGAYPPPTMPPPGGGGPDKKRTAVIIGSVLAVLLALGGTVYAVSGDDDDGGKPSAGAGEKDRAGEGDSAELDGGGGSGGDEEAGARPGDDGLTGSGGKGEGKVLWQKPAPDVAKSGVDTPGFWLADGAAVKAALESVTAYDAKDGKEKWSVELDGTICAASVNATDDGKAAVAYEGAKKDECSHVALIDLGKGEKVWDTALPKGGLGGYIGTTVAIGGDTVGASWFGGSALLKIGDGKELPRGERVTGCTPNGFAGGKALLRSFSCTAGGKLQKIGAGGRTEWTYTAPEGFNISNIFSADPVVVSLSDKDNKSGGILAIGAGGKVRSQIDLGKETYRPACGMRIMSQKLDGCQGVAASDDLFYLPTEDKKKSGGDGFGRYNEIHAFDLDTGKRKWKSAAGDDLTMMPLRTDGEKLIAYQKPTYDKSGRIVSIGAKGGKPTTLMKNPEAARDAENGFYAPFLVYEDDRFYLASDRVTGSSSGSPEKLLLVIGKG
ncbi:PQQ-binding-like beta-propeller repeat protein [Streptomyces albus]|uniref:outer membrane protein assembly factor BamB family protein n=1 Tax=Streptomyces albus TaxID=1888 RepID=UPI00068B79E7|nr:PQQ-binding-like beta-propeller repeat protein [Streptomyces albus]